MGCLQRCKVPVLLVKTGPRLDLDVPRIKRQGRDGTPGLNIAVSMDSSSVSERALDMACKVATKLDTLYVYHVVVPTEADTTPMVQELRERLLAWHKELPPPPDPKQFQGIQRAAGCVRFQLPREANSKQEL